MKAMTWIFGSMISMLFVALAGASDGASVCKATQTVLLPNGERAPVGINRSNGNRHIELFDFSGGHHEEFEATFCGPWLDITNDIRPSGRIQLIGEVAKGVENRFVAGRTERPYITLRFRINSGGPRDRSGRIVLGRPGIPGTGPQQAVFTYELKPSIRLHPVSAVQTIDLASDAAEQRLFLTGNNMNLIISGARDIPSNLPVESVRVISRTPESVELAVHFRRRGSLTLGSLFDQFLRLSPGAVLLPNPVPSTMLVRVEDANAPVHGQRQLRVPARIGVGGSETGNEGIGGGVRIGGRIPPAPAPGPGHPPAAPSGAPDLGVQIENAFTGSFDVHEINRLGLCPANALDPAKPTVKLIPKLRLSVTNFGNAASAASTLSFNRGGNGNFDRDQSFQVPNLAPGESRSFEIERKDNRVCCTHDRQRCAHGIHLGRFIPTVVDEKGKVVTAPANPLEPDRMFHWDDVGVTATISAVVGDANTANNSMTIRRAP